MVLSLQGVYAPERRNMSITIRTHRDNHAMAFIAPNTLDGIKVNRWLDAGSKCTEINITSTSGKSDTLYLEDISGHLIVSGNIEDGKQKFGPVGGNRDFDLKVTDQGTVRMTCWNGYTWGNGLTPTIELNVPALRCACF